MWITSVTPSKLPLASCTGCSCQNHRKLHVRSMQRQLSRERHSSMSYCNWCPLWENFCRKIVAMRLIKKKKKPTHIQKGQLVVIFAPFYFHQRIHILTEHVHCFTSLMLMLKGTQIFKETAGPFGIKWKETNQGSGKRRVMAKLAQVYFLGQSYFSDE